MKQMYKVVEIDGIDKGDAFVTPGLDKVYSLDAWDHVLIIEVGQDFNINRNAVQLQKTFGYGTNRPVIITRTPMRFFRVEPVARPGFWSRTWAAVRSLLGRKART